MKDLEELLPSASGLDPWTVVDEPFRYQARNLFDFINGAAEIFLEYGFVEVISEEVERGDDAIICTIHEMKDPEAAFGIFSYTRSPQKTRLELGDGAFIGELQLAFWQDRYFVKVESFSTGERMKEALVSFARQISEKIGAHAAEPAILEKLPRKGLISGSEKLLEGRLAFNSLLVAGRADAFELGAGDRVLYGEYGAAPVKTKLFLLFYGEAEKASSVERALGDSPRLSSRLRADFLALVVDAPSARSAEAILEEIP